MILRDADTDFFKLSAPTPSGRGFCFVRQGASAAVSAVVIGFTSSNQEALINFMDKHKEAGGNTFMKSIQGLANVLALMTAFFATGPLYTSTVGWVIEFTVEHYGSGLSDIASMLWGVMCALLVFFIARASIGTALMFGAAALMMRFL